MNRSELPFTIQNKSKSTFATSTGTPKKVYKGESSLVHTNEEGAKIGRRFVSSNENRSNIQIGIGSTNDSRETKQTPKRFTKLGDLEYTHHTSVRTNTNKSDNLMFPKVDRELNVPSTFRGLSKDKTGTGDSNNIASFYKSDKNQAEMLTSMPSSFFNDPDFLNKYINSKKSHGGIIESQRIRRNGQRKDDLGKFKHNMSTETEYKHDAHFTKELFNSKNIMDAEESAYLQKIKQSAIDRMNNTNTETFSGYKQYLEDQSQVTAKRRNNFNKLIQRANKPKILDRSPNERGEEEQSINKDYFHFEQHNYISTRESETRLPYGSAGLTDTEAVEKRRQDKNIQQKFNDKVKDIYEKRKLNFSTTASKLFDSAKNSEREDFDSIRFTTKKMIYDAKAESK